MSSDDRIVNGEKLIPVYAWLYGDYLLSSASAHTPESGYAHVTVARIGARLGWEADHRQQTLTYVDTMWTLPDAVQRADVDRAERRAAGA